MCGIAGAVGVADVAAVHAMTGALAHRGPDDQGTYSDPDGRVSLGHRRLAIIDLSAAGRQPMSCTAGRYQIVLNGEIYNYRALGAELEGRGWTFRSNSDTEAVLAAYAEWGTDCLARLRGMFALAIYDRGASDRTVPERAHLLLARDRFGIKPLYYARVGRGLVFASELKGLLASGLVSRVADPQAVWDYLSLGSVPPPRTILANVRALLPAHALRVDLGGEVRCWRYWDLATAASAEAPSRPPRYRDAVVELRRHLEEATRLHLVGDVPVGAFLSGGVDSSTLVGLMSRQSSRPIKTYAVGFEARHAQLSELRWARLAAERFGTEHTEVIVGGDEVADTYDALIGAIDQPSLDGTNTYFVARAARTGVTVALSGLGGDELFAGYPHFRRFRRAEPADGRRAWLRPRAILHRVAGALPGPRAERGFRDLAPLERHATVRCLANEAEKARIAGPILRGRPWEPLEALYARWLRPELDPVAQVSYVELNGYLAHTLLRDVDAMSMAHALEVRPVLLDHPLAEFAFALPDGFKLDGPLGKRVLRDAVRDVVPDAIRRRSKMGFELPLWEWLSGPLRRRAALAFSSKPARAVFSDGFLTEARSALAAGQPAQVRLWAYAMLLEWLEAYRCEIAERGEEA